MTMTALSVNTLTKTFVTGEIAAHAARSVDLDVESGEVVLIMGPEWTSPRPTSSKV